MKRDNIFKDLEEIFRTIFDDETINLCNETTAADIEDWDSLEQINLIVAIEHKYNIKFNIADVGAMRNVGDMVDAILKRVS